MILLDTGHHMLKEMVVQRLGPDNEEARKSEIPSMVVADFDDVSYRVQSKDSIFTLFFTMSGFRDIMANGLEKYLGKAYDKDDIAFSFKENTIDGVTYNFSMTFDLAVDRGEGAAAFAERVSCIKRNALAAPMFNYFEAIKAGTAPAQAVKIPFRKDESIYLKKGNDDQCVVIFSVTFQEKNDWVVAEVFLREFADARRDPALQQAPAANFSRGPPGELTGLAGVEQGDNVFFISFTLFKRHWDDKAEASMSAICQFRNFLHYHIKASKTYMHGRMRKRLDDLLQVLNRAKPAAEGVTEKKTWGGKSAVSR